ncbi:P-II family nitrogen regulator [Clostridium algoriphilum]|uniref:P-II family nitrogen regulator n=1 Tax=Clostridium algoriphilum TaxID=198347 RepID=UPI001CF52E62|nr:P-II family nitrogen regulator [Clostridium algoriphilum]MCB2293874.1 P-II family nitrogen regulator [Clostridium algoriphilum]
MKEITAIIRMDMVNKTKEALLKLAVPSMTAIKVMGRGKKKIAYELFQNAFDDNGELPPILAEQLSEVHRLMPKRMIILDVEDKDVEGIVKAIIDVNQNGNPGNGKIFVTTVNDIIRIRTGETGIEAV